MRKNIFRFEGIKKAVRALRIAGKIVGLILAIFGLFQIYDFFHERLEQVVVSPAIIEYGVRTPELGQVVSVVNKTNETLYDVRIDVTAKGAPETVKIDFRAIDHYQGGPSGVPSKHSLADSAVYYFPMENKKGRLSANAILMRLGPKETRQLSITTTGTPAGWNQKIIARVNIVSIQKNASNASRVGYTTNEEQLILWSNFAWDTSLDGTFKIIEKPWILDGGLTTNEDRSAFLEVSKSLERHDFSTAKSIIEDRLRDFESVAMLKTLAMILICEKKYKEALFFSEKVVENEPNDEVGYLLVLENAYRLKNIDMMKKSLEKLESIPRVQETSIHVVSKKVFELAYYIHLLESKPNEADAMLEKVCADYTSRHMLSFYFAARSIYRKHPQEALIYLRHSKKVLPSRFWELNISTMISCGLRMPPDSKWNDLVATIEANNLQSF